MESDREMDEESQRERERETQGGRHAGQQGLGWPQDIGQAALAPLEVDDLLDLAQGLLAIAGSQPLQRHERAVIKLAVHHLLLRSGGEWGRRVVLEFNVLPGLDCLVVGLQGGGYQARV